MRVSAIVVNHRRAELTRACLLALREDLATLDAPSELILVDNGSGDDSCELARAAVPDVSIVALDQNVGFAAGAAAGIRRSRGEWVALINNDVIVERGTLGAMLAVGESSETVGSVAAQMRFADEPEVINSAGIEVDRLGIPHDRLLGLPASAGESAPVEVFGASGGAALLRRRMLDEVGGIDETFFFALDDVDLAWRARMAGWRCLYAPAAVVHHRHGATGTHASDLKYFHVGLNRVRTLAKNADRGLLVRYGLAMAAYDAAYVVYTAATDRTLAPLRGRVRGLREWRAYRRAGERRLPVELNRVQGLRAALARRRVWEGHSAAARAGSVASTR